MRFRQEEPMDSTKADEQEVLRLHRAYLHANDLIDPTLLKGVWSDDPSNVYFNLSGHTYRGLAHWTKLWNYYSTRIEQIVPYTSVEPLVKVHGDVAFVAAARFGATRWIGDGEPPFPDGVTPSRSTEIFVREPEGWRTVHSHFSRGTFEPRPGGI